MKTIITTTFLGLLFITVGFLLHGAVNKTEMATCKKYVSQALEIKGWFISQADYEMCQFYGMDFSEFVK